MPRDTLTADRIIRAAIELLDEEGLDGLNMRSLAKRLGSAATAVYWHIKTKDDLVRLAGDVLWTEIDQPDPDTTDWRTAATAQATGMHAMLTRHPWLGQAFGSHFLYGPGQSRHNDLSLAIYEKAGFGAADADRAAATVFVFALGSALGPASQISLTRRLARNGEDAEQRMNDAMASATETALRFPRLRERLGTPAAEQYAAAPEDAFVFGLRAVLDGFEARLAAADDIRRER
ncbi:TetR/AcrR family transcriptional regulator C-terminal domain-containing protein [Streptomyces sp. NPDC047017]|uniref:TetR/AcrR family transcriptional regulator n=1 Tax=Streptomyces sp. NPDC047017 TaxID=3155024 RepID=UPI0033C15506